MEISTHDDEGDPPLLIDSGTESYTESPVTEEEAQKSDAFALSPCQSEDSTVLFDRDIDPCTQKLFVSSQNLLDKAISIDEDSLDTPLEPTKYGTTQHTITTSMNVNHMLSTQEIAHFEMKHDSNSLDIVQTLHSKDSTVDSTFEENVLDTWSSSDKNATESSCSHGDERTLTSILRRQQQCHDSEYESLFYPVTTRKVSFPTDSLLATYREPEFREHWDICDAYNAKEILLHYEHSCKRHQTIVLDTIKKQILEIKDNRNRSATLNLASLTITREVCETLEDLLKVSNFRSIVINDCKFTQETIREFLNMLEYYESVSELVISEDFDDREAWKTLCTIIGKSNYLEAITFKEMTINEEYMRYFINALKQNEYISVLKFDSCALAKLPCFYLVENIINVTSIGELYLPQTGLYTKEADCLGKYLSKNSYLQVLDISNNSIGDRGLEVLAKGLTNQSKYGPGLSVLVIFNNQITERSAPTISKVIAECGNLHALNIGFNNLTDEVIPRIKESLIITKSLEGLGLQSTLLTSIGVSELAEAIENNCSLQKVNLKGNKAIQIDGLEHLSRALTKSRIIKIELEETNRSCNDPQSYLELVQKINGICTINKSLIEQSKEDELNLSRLVSRKVSLSCEPRYVSPPVLLESSISGSRIKSPIPSPMPSPGCSPAPRSRFQVSKVPDKLPTSPSYSRFKVLPVTSPVTSLGSGDGVLVCSPPPDEEEEEENRFPNVRSSVSSIDSVDSLTPSRDSFPSYSSTESGKSD